MFKRILVAVDGSAPSDRALAAGLKLAKEQRAKLRIVHVADVLPPANVEPMYVDFESYRDAILTGGRAMISSAATQARRARVKAETRLLETLSHDLSGEIIAEATRFRADLIMLGTHGRTGLVRIFLGSVAEGVVRHSSTAVLLIRGAAKSSRTRRAAARTTRRKG